MERTCGSLSQINSSYLSADKGNNAPHSVLQGFIFSVSYTQWKCKFPYLLPQRGKAAQSFLRHILGIQSAPYPMHTLMGFVLAAVVGTGSDRPAPRAAVPRCCTAKGLATGCRALGHHPGREGAVDSYSHYRVCFIKPPKHTTEPVLSGRQRFIRGIQRCHSCRQASRASAPRCFPWITPQYPCGQTSAPNIYIFAFLPFKMLRFTLLSHL